MRDGYPLVVVLTTGHAGGTQHRTVTRASGTNATLPRRRRYIESRGANDQVHPPPEVTAGAGDAFIAAFAVAVGRGDDLAAATRLAAGAAGHTVAHLGGRPTFNDESELWAVARTCEVSEADSS
jgi:sugar/nucleoside kinase (ribokinase family)